MHLLHVLDARHLLQLSECLVHGLQLLEAFLRGTVAVEAKSQGRVYRNRETGNSDVPLQVARLLLLVVDLGLQKALLLQGEVAAQLYAQFHLHLLALLQPFLWAAICAEDR